MNISKYLKSLLLYYTKITTYKSLLRISVCIGSAIVAKAVIRMGTTLVKRGMAVKEINLQYITPAVISKWSRGKIAMEAQITNSKINLK